MRPDTTYHISLPPELLGNETDRRPRHGGLDLGPRGDFSEHIAVGRGSLDGATGFARIGKRMSLWEIALGLLEAVKDPAASEMAWGDGGFVQLAIFVCLATNSPVLRSAIFVAQHLSIDLALLAWREQEPRWPSVGHPIARIQYSPGSFIQNIPGCFQLVGTLWRLQQLAESPDGNDREREWAHLLRLFFLDAVDSSRGLELFHCTSSDGDWALIRQQLTEFRAWGMAVKYVAGLDFTTAFQKAYQVEDWVTTQIVAPTSRADGLQEGEVTYRILHVLTKFHDILVSAFSG
ncbi:hypothetical protein JCM11491_004788 [Sporobolomyces phaffii]